MIPIPFYQNLPDGIHCLQACLRSALEGLKPGSSFSFEEIDALTGFQPDKLTWPMKAYVEVAKLGFQVTVYDSMDFAKFVETPVGYMEIAFGVEASKLYCEKSDISQAVADALCLLSYKAIDVRKEVPGWTDLDLLLKKDRLCICHVDQKILNATETQSDHSVLVRSRTDHAVVFNDPGLVGAQENRVVTVDLFEAAWSSPADDAKTIFAIGN